MNSAASPHALGLEDVRRAAEAIRGQVIATPTTRSRTLSEITGADVVLKFENHQFTASFKDRGALVKLLSLDGAERRRGVVAMSAGNHAQAVAYHAQRLGIPAVIVMPRFTPNVKVEHTRAFGAEVWLEGETLDEAAACAHRLEGERGLVFVHPYDDVEVIRGQGTVALELLAAWPDREVLVVPVGGGGLVSGMAIAARGLAPQVEVVGVQSARFPTMKQALAGEPIRCGVATMAEGIAVKSPGRLTVPIVCEHVREILLVDEAQLERAVLLLLEIEKTVVEGAGAAGLAALLAYPERFRGRRVGLVLSGGNIDLLALSSVIQRGLVKTGRLVRIRVDVRDVPGALGEVATKIGAEGGSIVEVHHSRAFSHLSLESAEVELTLQTRGLAHAAEIVHALRAAGHPTAWIDPHGGAARPRDSDSRHEEESA